MALIIRSFFLEDNDALIPADVFFAKIMEDTDTYITWPNKLKIGAKSKKGKSTKCRLTWSALTNINRMFTTFWNIVVKLNAKEKIPFFIIVDFF